MLKKKNNVKDEGAAAKWVQGGRGNGERLEKKKKHAAMLIFPCPQPHQVNQSTKLKYYPCCGNDLMLKLVHIFL